MIWRIGMKLQHKFPPSQNNRAQDKCGQTIDNPGKEDKGGNHVTISVIYSEAPKKSLGVTAPPLWA